MSIAEKLRQAYHNDLTDVPLLLDAADEIDRLERERDEHSRPVAWTGSGSLAAVANKREGHMWPEKADAHPIPLYLAPATPSPEPIGLVERLDKVAIDISNDKIRPHAAETVLVAASELTRLAGEVEQLRAALSKVHDWIANSYYGPDEQAGAQAIDDVVLAALEAKP
jgi:hypothetical protein